MIAPATNIYEMQAQLCKAFAHPTRLHILDLLGDGPRGTQELIEQLGVTKTNLSQHLRILRSAGVVGIERRGKQIYCSLAIREVKNACSLMRSVLHRQAQLTRGI